jgi:Hemerythrin HHE cation binding domain
MVTPVDAVRAFHNGFRRDMAIIDKAALDAARGQPGLDGTIDRFRFFNEVLVIHASGEELGIFPALEQVAPQVAEAYIQDHRGLDSAFDALGKAVSAHDPLATARATAAFKFHLDIHLAKEDTHLYRLFAERLSLPEQGKAVGIMASTVPSQRYPELIAWLFPLLGPDDRENLVRIWQTTMPADNFAGAVQLIRKAVGDDWAELARRVPGL